MTWPFIQLAQTMTASGTRIIGPSNAMIVTLASKHACPCSISVFSRWVNCFTAIVCFVLDLGSRAGVAQYMKTEWRVVAIFNVVLFVVLVRQTNILALFQDYNNQRTLILKVIGALILSTFVLCIASVLYTSWDAARDEMLQGAILKLEGNLLYLWTHHQIKCFWNS